LVAHPDDEVLACGGWIARLAKQDHELLAIFTTNGIRHPPLSTDSRADAYEALAILGVRRENVHFLGIETQRSDQYVLRDFTSLVESKAERVDVVITTSGHDLNVDHRFAYQLALICFRPINYRTRIVTAEILSSSEYSDVAFQPNLYVDVSETIELKLSALKRYEKQVVAFPHPRSPEAVRIKAQQRGLECGLSYAEAYHIVRWFD
jgi:LmbE family N-acetylglucosaminyl deacetylase